MTNILVASYINTKGAKKNAISRAVRAMQGETTLRIESADVVTAATTSFPAPYSSAVLTIAANSGEEFECHEQMIEALAAAVYFADPYSS